MQKYKKWSSNHKDIYWYLLKKMFFKQEHYLAHRKTSLVPDSNKVLRSLIHSLSVHKLCISHLYVILG